MIVEKFCGIMEPRNPPYV